MPNKKEEISLSAVVGGVVQALREAKRLGDTESAKLFELYKKEKTLYPFTVPAFTISDADIELRFSILKPSEEEKGKGQILDLKVDVSSESLKKLEAHHVSVLKLKIAPVSLRVFEEKK